jgi:hypothetical protein
LTVQTEESMEEYIDIEPLVNSQFQRAAHRGIPWVLILI